MRILFICDYRSPTAQNWIKFWRSRHDVTVLSTYPLEGGLDAGVPVIEVPIAFSGMNVPKKGNRQSVSSDAPLSKRVLRNLLTSGTAHWARNAIAPIELRRHVGDGKRIIEQLQPDLVHALRIPFEGIFASMIVPDHIPLVCSIWGIDFTHQASAGPLIRRAIRSTMSRADCAMADCHRDIRLAYDWGFDANRETLVIPGAGGVDTDMFSPGHPSPETLRELSICEGAAVFLNPRGIRDYVIKTAETIKAFSQLLKRLPNAVLICLGTEGHGPTERLVDSLGIGESVRLLPLLDQSRLADIYRAAHISVSPTTHDGTPNSLLEAMACGAFPIAGDIESIREWITHGNNGLLFDPADPDEIETAMYESYTNRELRERGIHKNFELVKSRADYESGMRRTESLYGRLITEKARSQYRRAD